MTMTDRSEEESAPRLRKEERSVILPGAVFAQGDGLEAVPVEPPGGEAAHLGGSSSFMERSFVAERDTPEEAAEDQMPFPGMEEAHWTSDWPSLEAHEAAGKLKEQVSALELGQNALHGFVSSQATPASQAEDSAAADGERDASASFSEEEHSSGKDDDIPLAPLEPELAALRSLILQREIALIEQLKTRLDDPLTHAKDVSEVVAEAILLRTGKDDKLSRALSPLVEELFKAALRKRPLDFANVLFPLMGPAIRRSITETFRSMLESFHKTMEIAFSWRGLRWRLESWRTGKSFSEVVLLHTLAYRVEQLFFIHRDTGLVLSHVVNEGVVVQDADMVSAMLTAIQDFVRDCFVSGQESDLESLHMGEFTIWVEQSPYAYLACVLRGTPPLEFRKQLRSTLELLQVEFIEELAKFNGDASGFSLAARHLEDCLITRFEDEGKPLPLWSKLAPALALILLVGALVFWRYSAYVEKQQALMAEAEKAQKQEAFFSTMDGYVDKLRKEPGLVVVEVRDFASSPWAITCMRDELAREPAAVIAEAGGTAEDFHIKTIPYVSLEPPIVVKRIRQQIRPPANVQLRFFSDGSLHFSGTASMDWIIKARQQALALPGVGRVVMDELSDPRMAKLEKLVKEVETSSIEFPLGKDVPVPADVAKLQHVVDTLVELDQLATSMGMGAQLTVYGHADIVGNDKRNYEVSQARARTLAAMLYGKGSSLSISLYGMGAEYANKSVTSPLGDQASRRIEMRVHLSNAPSPGAVELLRQ